MNTKFLFTTAANFNKWRSDFLHFIYPKSCLVCNKEIVTEGLEVCPLCESELHYTFFEDFKEPTDLDKVFWGRIQLEGTYALLNFSSKNSTQPILHALKYGNNPKVGYYYGEMLGDKLKEIPIFSDVDALVPVPLHPKKQYERGYNQATALAKGIQRSFPVAIRPELLKRNAYTDTQTKRNRLSRWENMQNRFVAVKHLPNLPRHILLVDDVITTGATLESIVQELQSKFPTTRFSVVSLARAI